MENVLAEMSTLNILKEVHSLSEVAHLEPFSLCSKYSVLCIHVKTQV